MKAVIINEYGGPEVLQEQEVPKPEISDEQVLVEVHATSVNPIDWKLREGYLKGMLDWDFPIILGWDVAGIIVETGRNVRGFQPGDEVFARPDTTPDGTYATYTAVDKKLLAKKPENLSFEEAASVPLTGLTAWQCLMDVTGIKDGDKVLIHAGAGGVGSMAVQIAKNEGAYVATTASKKNEAYLQSLGADQVIDYQTTDFTKAVSDFDIVLDTLGGETLKKSFDVLKPGGRLVSIVGQPDEKIAQQRKVDAHSYWLVPQGEQLEKLGVLLERGIVKPQVGHTFSFSAEQLQKAHDLSATHHARGKIVIQVK